MFGTNRTAPSATRSVAQVMQHVLYALIPGTLLLFWLFGWGLLSNLILSIGFALLLEALMLKLRQRPLQPFLSDYSVLVTGWLLAVSLPPYAPWWLIAVAMLFAVVVAKHLYGGLGYNPFNPAMVGYAAVLISFPLEMTLWPAPFASNMTHIGLADTLQQVWGAPLAQWDAYTQATPLDALKTGFSLGESFDSLQAQAPPDWRAWGWVNIAYLMGGLWLLWRGIISWPIPVALLGTLGGLASLSWLLAIPQAAPPLWHLFAGASMLGAFFIATDPVSASTTPLGQLLYAAGIGFFTYIIRTWGGYPDAIAFAVLIMNMAVPLIDAYTPPRVYGTSRWRS